MNRLCKYKDAFGRLEEGARAVPVVASSRTQFRHRNQLRRRVHSL